MGMRDNKVIGDTFDPNHPPALAPFKAPPLSAKERAEIEAEMAALLDEEPS